LKEKVIISFFSLNEKEFKENLVDYETILIHWALKNNKVILNKKKLGNLFVCKEI